MSYKTNGYGTREAYNERRKRYRKATGTGLYKKRIYTQDEDELILLHSIPDRELSKKIKRSVTAIQSRRTLLKRGIYYYKKENEYAKVKQVNTDRWIRWR